MAAVGKITLDIKEYEELLARARGDMKKFSSGAQNDFKQVGKGASKAGRLISSMSAEAGGAFGKLGSIIGAVASGPVVALTAALGALVAAGVDILDRMTLSAEEYAKKLDIAAQAADKNRAAVEKQVAEDAGYIERLQQLADKEVLSNAAKAEAATLIKNLTSRYGDLGISIDEVTGKITGMDEAQKKFQERQKQQRMQALQEQMNATRRQALSQAKVSVKEGSAWGRNARMENVTALMSSAPIETQIRMAEKYRDSSNTQADMDRWQKTIEFLTKLRDLQREYNMLRSTGAASEKEQNTQQRKQTEKDQKKEDFLAAEKESLEIQRLINEGRTEEAKVLKLINELKKQGVKITKQEAEEIIRNRQRAESEKYYNETIEDLENQIQIQGMLNDGMTEEAKRQQIINDLKKRGLAYDEASVNRIMELNRQLGALKLKGAQKEQAGSLYDRALRAAGRGKEADERAALEQARKTKGSELTEEEKSRTLELLGLSQQLDKLSGSNFSGMAIQTNSLTSRGGFSTGAVVPDTEKYNRIIADNGKTMLSVVQRIETICRQFGNF